MTRIYKIVLPFLFLILLLTGCSDKKGKLTLTDIGSEYKGSFVAGQHIDGDYVFITAPPTAELLQGAKVTGPMVVLNVYPWVVGEKNDVPFTGDAEIPPGRLMLILMDKKNVHDADSVHGFVNIRVISLKNGSAEISFVTDMKKLP